MADAEQEQTTYSDDDDFASDGSYENEYDDEDATVDTKSEADTAVDQPSEQAPTHSNDAIAAAARALIASDIADSTSIGPSKQHSTFAVSERHDRNVLDTQHSLESDAPYETSTDAIFNPPVTEADALELTSSSPSSLSSSSAIASASYVTSEQFIVETERIALLVQSDESSAASAVTAASETDKRFDAPGELKLSAPRLLGLQPKADSLRSLSSSVIPAVIDPDMIAPRSTRSTSVPLVLTSDASERQSAGRFPVEGVTGGSGAARVRSFPRLPSVVEIQPLDDCDAAADRESDDDDASESDESDDNSRVAVPVQRSRSSSIQLSPPRLVLPVARAKSQPFMMRLPSVKEVTVEEIAAIEGMRTRNDDDDDADVDAEDDGSDDQADTYDVAVGDEADDATLSSAPITASASDTLADQLPAVITAIDTATAAPPPEPSSAVQASSLMMEQSESRLVTNDSDDHERRDDVRARPDVLVLSEDTTARAAAATSSAAISVQPPQQERQTESDDEYDDDEDDEQQDGAIVPSNTNSHETLTRSAYAATSAIADETAAASNASRSVEEPDYNGNDFESDEADSRANEYTADDDVDTVRDGRDAVDEANEENDDDDLLNVYFDDESSRLETEMLMREAQLLLQKQHDDASDDMAVDDGSYDNDDDDDNDYVSGSSHDVDTGNELTGVEFVAAPAAADETVHPSTNGATYDDRYGDNEFSDAADGFDDTLAADGTGVAEECEDNEPTVVAEQSLSKIDSAAMKSATADPLHTNASSLASAPTSAASSDKDTILNAVAVAEPSNAVVDDSQSRNVQSDGSASERDAPAVPSTELLPSEHASVADDSKPDATATLTVQRSIDATRLDTAMAPTRPTTTRPSRPTASVTKRQNEPSVTRPARPAATVRVGGRESLSTSPRELKRERPRELRQRPERTAQHVNATATGSHSVRVSSASASSLRSVQAQTDGSASKQLVAEPPAMQPVHSDACAPVSTAPTHAAAVRSTSPKREAQRSPERVAVVDTPRLFVEENELLTRKASVYRQPRGASKSRAEKARRKLLPVKSPPNLRIELPTMDKTKRNWLLLNMFRHGDDVSKYEPFMPAMTPSVVTAAAASLQRPTRPTSAAAQQVQQVYASSQAAVVAAYGGNAQRSRNGRCLMQQHQSPPDPTLRERERNWASVKPLESAIPSYDSILDKFCTTVTSPVVQRQIYDTRLNDLSPQLAYVLEKRVERQWRSEATAETIGGAAAVYRANAGSPRAKS